MTHSRKFRTSGKVTALYIALSFPVEETTMIAVIDNYDSFTYNLVQFLGELILHQQVPGTYSDREIRVWRNDEIDVEELADLKPTHIVISPGPGTPEQDSGISNDVIRILGRHTPVLGVCLGQQCIGYV